MPTAPARTGFLARLAAPAWLVACPTGDWAADLPADRPILRVRAGAPAGGDGSESSPFATIGEAVGGAGS